MKILKTMVIILGLPLFLQATEVVRFDAQLYVTTNSPNERFDFTLDPSTPMVSQKTTTGYSGPDIYGAMNMKSGAYWRVAQKNESGLSVRLNKSAGNWANGLFLMQVDSVQFSKGNDTMNAADIFTSQIQRLKSASVRFVIKAGKKFYISEPSADFCKGDSGHQTDAFMIHALEAKWFNYDPVQDFETISIIGSPASPRFVDIDFVGFTLFAKGSEAGKGVNFGVRSFSVTAR